MFMVGVLKRIWDHGPAEDFETVNPTQVVFSVADNRGGRNSEKLVRQR